jgi:hypothetical protein
VSDELFGPALRAHLRRGDGAPDDPVAAAGPETEEERLVAVAEREAELAAREHALAAAADRLRREHEQLAAREQELARREAALADANRRPVREVLRAEAELVAERLWSVFHEALEASTADGHVDHTTRIAAVQALLGEAYAAEPAADGAEPPLDLPEALR